MKQTVLKSSGKHPKTLSEEQNRIIAAKIHEMRQPLQVMSLLHGVLAEKIKDQDAQKMITKLEEVLGSINKVLESFPASKSKATFCLHEKLDELSEKFSEMEEVVSSPALENSSLQSTLYVVDDDTGVREGMGAFLTGSGYTVELYESCEKFLEQRPPDSEGCLLVDALLPGMSGLELLQQLKEKKYRSPAVMITGNGDVSLAVQAMKAGAIDFVEKPVNPKDLLSVINRVQQQAHNDSGTLADREAAIARLACLSAREKQIMDWIFAGHQSKNIAADLGISRRTVEAHRANIMKKTGVRTLSGLLKLALTATGPHTKVTLQ